MHTPEQAKSLWCPMVRHEGDVGGSFNRSVNNNDPINKNYSGGRHHGCACVADQCAMWRWNPTTLLHPGTGALTSMGPGGLTDRIPANGYCGLAPVHGVAG